MIKLNGFHLSGYKKTTGREGEGFCATLKYGSQSLATYEDYATGGLPVVKYLSHGDGADALEKTVQGIRDVLTGDSIRSSMAPVELMCTLLDELREILSCAGNRRGFAIFLLMGNTWAMSKANLLSPLESSVIITDPLPESIKDMAMAKGRVAETVKEAMADGEFTTLTGVWVVDLDQRPKFTLTLEEYLEIYKVNVAPDKGDDALANHQG